MSMHTGMPRELSVLLGALAQRAESSSDREVIEMVRRSVGPLEKLCEAIVKNKKNLEKIKKRTMEVFDDTDHVESELDGQNGTLGVFPAVAGMVSNAISSPVNDYLKMAVRYEFYVKDKINTGREGFNLGDHAEVDLNMEDDGMSNDRGRDLINPREMNAAQHAHDILYDSMGMFLAIKKMMPLLVARLHKGFESYDKYLRDRFIKPEEDEGANRMREVFETVRNGDNRARGEYVKVKLVDNNPVLTDVLLDLMDDVPLYNTRDTTGRRGRKKSVRTLSDFSVRRAAERLAAVSDPRFMEYIEDPSKFSGLIGKTISHFYDVFKEIEGGHKAILEMPHARIITDDQDGIDRTLSDKDNRKVGRRIETIKGIDLSGIVQNEDDVTPENRREIDSFALRDKIFTKLREGMKDLSIVDDPTERAEYAEEIIREIVDIKDEMLKVDQTDKSRRLRQDRGGDNEYYAGRQHGPGQFHFERMPAPQVKIEDVVGESFDRAKGHLAEIVETGTSSRIMQMTAPGQKVRSNILLIGPYGCGKTELGRAICGDPRVIGASVSVANTLTAYMHESVGNIKRIYDQAMELRSNARDVKPVTLILDEFDGWFPDGSGGYGNQDMEQIQNVFLEVLDGMEDYNGIITIGMTNNPRQVPDGIMRRFRYVDIVGQLTQDERSGLLKMFLEKSLPVSDDIADHYSQWAERLEDAPGDVVRKVVDEVHFELVPNFIKKHQGEARRVERVLYNRENRNGILEKKDVAYLRGRLAKYDVVATPAMVDGAITALLKQPQIKKQIEAAKDVYEDAAALLDEISSPSERFGFRRRNRLFDVRN